MQCYPGRGIHSGAGLGVWEQTWNSHCDGMTSALMPEIWMPAYTHDFRCASTMSRPMAAPAPALLAQAPQSVLSLQRAALWRRPRTAARACRPALLKSLHSPTLCHAVRHRAAALPQAAGRLRVRRSQSSFQGRGGLFTRPACRPADQPIALGHTVQPQCNPQTRPRRPHRPTAGAGCQTSMAAAV